MKEDLIGNAADKLKSSSVAFIDVKLEITVKDEESTK